MRVRLRSSSATDLPVSADLENGFADDPAGVAETLRLALAAGLAGASIEDYSGREEAPIYEIGAAAERVAAAAEVAHGGPVRWSSPRGRRTTARGHRPRPTRSPACRPTKRPVRTSSTHPASAASRTSARSSPRSISPSTSSPSRGALRARAGGRRGAARLGRRCLCLRRTGRGGRSGAGAARRRHLWLPGAGRGRPAERSDGVRRGGGPAPSWVRRLPATSAAARSPACRAPSM